MKTEVREGRMRLTERKEKNLYQGNLEIKVSFVEKLRTL
jgi:hypothetical protein